MQSDQARPFLLHVHALDQSHLKVIVTDLQSNTWEAIRSVQQFEDMRDNIGIGGSWSEFVDYVVASIKSEDVKLVMEGPSKLDCGWDARIGSAAGAILSSATFLLEVARKHMQAGALNGRQYKNMLHALVSILEIEGVADLYRGLGPSCMKLVLAAGISFMCYEACKRILFEEEDEA